MVRCTHAASREVVPARHATALIGWSKRNGLALIGCAAQATAAARLAASGYEINRVDVPLGHRQTVSEAQRLAPNPESHEFCVVRKTRQKTPVLSIVLSRTGRTGAVHRLLTTLTIVLALQCQGCSLSYNDSHGYRHVIGMLDITIHPPAAPKTFAGDVVDLTSIGLAVGQTAQGGYVSIGYSHEVSANLRDNALVIGDIIHPLGSVGQ
jgi:hypothetical protein